MPKEWLVKNLSTIRGCILRNLSNAAVLVAVLVTEHGPAIFNC